MYKLIFFSLNILVKSFLNLMQILPYLIAGTIIGEILKYVKLHRVVEKRFHSKHPNIFTFGAAVLGMASPLCTYGTVPIVMRFGSSGVPIPVLIVFLISSSMMNPQLFILTWGGIGWQMAVMRVLTILIFALLMGWLLKIIPKKFVINNKCLEDFNKIKSEKSCTVIFTWKSFLVNILKNLEYVGFFVAVGVILSSAIEVLVPAGVVNMLYQHEKFLQILILSLLSIPFYSCGGGVIPIVNSMISGGMSNGTALAFLNVGAASRITVLSALASIVRPLFIVVYVLILVIFSVITGYLYV